MDNIHQIWDDGYPSGGNYWSDYQDVDLYKGPYQNETGSDGIWDHPYVPTGMPWYLKDNYPLVNPWKTSIDATVDIVPGIFNLHSNLPYITAFIELPEGYYVGDIATSSIILNNTVSADSSSPVSIGNYDGDSIPDLMVKFDATLVKEFIKANINVTQLFKDKKMTVTLTIAGRLNNGILFQGSDNVTILVPPSKGKGKYYPV